jgi:hypothetical protein
MHRHADFSRMSSCPPVVGGKFKFFFHRNLHGAGSALLKRICTIQATPMNMKTITAYNLLVDLRWSAPEE